MAKRPRVVRLTLDGDDALDREKLSFMHQGMVLGYSHRANSGLDRMRRVAFLMDKLESVSEPVYGENGAPVFLLADGAGGGDQRRELTPGKHELNLDLGEVDILTESISNVPWRATRMGVAVATLEWLAAPGRGGPEEGD